MVTAKGTLIRVSANRIVAKFFTDGLDQTFNATVNSAMQPFTSNIAELTYDNFDDLTGQRSYQGRMGPKAFVLSFENGPVIKGNLNAPGIEPPVAVQGTGHWESG